MATQQKKEIYMLIDLIYGQWTQRSTGIMKLWKLHNINNYNFYDQRKVRQFVVFLDMGDKNWLLITSPQAGAKITESA